MTQIGQIFADRIGSAKICSICVHLRFAFVDD
jgi:hypothetical protein